MADIKTMREKDWIMHSIMTSLPTNVFKQITTTTINPVLEDVLGTLEVVEQQMRQLNKGERQRRRGGNRGRGGRGRGAGGNTRGGGQSSAYINYSNLGCFRCGGSHFRDQCEKMPSECTCTYCNTTGHVDKVCLKKQRVNANVSEETKTEEKDKGEDKKDEKRNQTPPAGGRDFSCPEDKQTSSL